MYSPKAAELRTKVNRDKAALQLADARAVSAASHARAASGPAPSQAMGSPRTASSASPASPILQAAPSAGQGRAARSRNGQVHAWLQVPTQGGSPPQGRKHRGLPRPHRPSSQGLGLSVPLAWCGCEEPLCSQKADLGKITSSAFCDWNF